MVNIKKGLYQGLKYQGFDPEEIMICFNIMLKEEYILPYCFFVDEDKDTLTVVTTTEEGSEEIRIVPKQSILYVQMVYEMDDIFEEEDNDNTQERMYA